MTTGSFLKSAAANDCWPFPPAPYAGLTLNPLFNNILKIRIRTKCSEMGPMSGKDCLNEKMFLKMRDIQMKEIKSKVVGLDIEKFQHKPKGNQISVPSS
jgi:hypothetical protein